MIKRKIRIKSQPGILVMMGATTTNKHLQQYSKKRRIMWTAASGCHGGGVAASAFRKSFSTSPIAMPLLYSPAYTVELPDRHSFPMHRYKAVHALMQSVLPEHMQILPSLPMDAAGLLPAHTQEWVNAFMEGTLDRDAQRAIGFPWSPEFVHRTLAITGGTLQAMAWALAHPGAIAANMAGGTHHAFADRGEGYCIFNDLAVAAVAAIAGSGLPHVTVVDLDVHQGNGTASMLAGEACATTFSVHADKNYPWSTRRPSTVDVALPDEVGGEEYLVAVRQGLQQLEAAWEARGLELPSLVLYQAGVDPLEQDRLGRLGLSRTTLHRRNDVVFEWVRGLDARRGSATPVVVTMGGGYSIPIQHSARAHVDVFQQAGQLHKSRMEGRHAGEGAAAAAAVSIPGGGWSGQSGIGK